MVPGTQKVSMKTICIVINSNSIIIFLSLMIVNKRVQKTPKSPCFIFLDDWEDRGMLKGKVKSKEGTDLWGK